MRDAIKLLSDKGLSWDKPSLEEYYNALLHSADGQVELLYNLLRWAQVQTGRMIFRPMYFDLIPRVKSELRLVRVLAERKGVVVVDELPDNALVTADADMLTTIIRNLLTNAVKFTPQGGTVRLTVTAFSDGGLEGHIRVKVEDTGVGMTPEQLENLFRIDSNQSRTGTAGEQGTGLGLTVCRDMLMKHNSTLHVESEAGKGSVFGFEI